MSLVAWNQQERMAAELEVVATRRRANTNNFTAFMMFGT
jgi:hypothetical protein